MAIADSYRKQVSLLIRTIPLVAAEKEFALKGGTAINLFLRDMPRLSVDIDLTYIPVADRATSLKGIDFGMKRIADGLTKGVPNVELSTSVLRGESCTTKLLMRADDAQIKIEVTPVLRGCVYDEKSFAKGRRAVWLCPNDSRQFCRPICRQNHGRS